MKTKEMKEIISKLKPAFKANELTGIGKYLYLYDKKAIAYNGDLAIMVDTDLDIEVALPIAEFDKFINKVMKEEIEIEVSNSIELKAGRIKANFARNEEMLEKIKQVKFDKVRNFKKLPEDFLKGVKLVQYSISKDASRPAYTYMYVHGNKLASTDNFRISEYTMESEMEEVKIPVNTVLQLSRYNLESYCLNDSFIYFKTKDNIIIMSQIGNLDFVRYEKVLEVEGDIFEFPEDTKTMIDTVEITVDGSTDIDRSIDVNIFDGNIMYSSSNEIGEIEGEIEVDSDLEFSFKISPEFLKAILEITNKAIISSNRLLFETDNFKQVIALFESTKRN